MLAARATFVVLAGVVIFYLLPDGGVTQFKRMNQAMQNARSWRSHSVVTEPAHEEDSMMEVYCPSQIHSKNTVTAGTTSTESEIIETANASYIHKEGGWERAEKIASSSGVCFWGPRGIDGLLGQLDAVMRLGKISKGSSRFVNGERCRDWTGSVPAPSISSTTN